MSKTKLLHIKTDFLEFIHRRLIKLGVPLCRNHCCFNFGKHRRQNTAYHDEKMNWVYCCPRCYEEIQEYWAERWSEYWSSVF